MKKLICVLVALMLTMSLAVNTFAAKSEFVPSITYKDGLIISSATLDGKNVTGCVVVTSLKAAEDKTTDLSQAERDQLLDLYRKLLSGEMELPLDGNYTIRELVDVSFGYNSCRGDSEHGDKNSQLGKQGVTLAVDFDTNLKANEKLKVLTYVDGKWKVVENVTVNKDGTVTALFEEICPVVFCVEKAGGDSSSKTGDLSMSLWIGTMVVATAAVAVLLTNRRRIAG